MCASRRHRELIYLLAAVVWICDGCYPLTLKGAQSPSAEMPPPSVVLITLDTVRADRLGCYGYQRIATPSIDGLASQGMRFERAYAQVPLTLPSHTVILTGTYPISNGVRDLTSPGLNTSVPTLAAILRQKGYSTAAFVSSFVLNSMWGLNRGFDVYDDGTDQGQGASQSPSILERRGDRTMDRALGWLNSHADQPFFLWIHLYDPHSPYRPPEPYLSRYAGRLYDGEIAFDDAQLGRLFARLRQLKLYESALIALAADHGESLGEHGEAEHGFFVYTATLHVPLIIKTPGRLPRSRVVTDAVGLVDLAPTIADLCGIPRSFTGSFQGHTLAGIYERDDPQHTQAVYAESYYPRSTFGWHELRAILTPQYQFINAPRPELYDLRRDWDEKHDLASGQSALAFALREELQRIETRYANTRPAPGPSPLDPATIEKLRSLGYVAYQASAPVSDSQLSRADPKDKILALNQMLRAGDLRVQRRFAESDDILTKLEHTESSLYIIAFERGETLLDWGKPRDAITEFRKALALNPSFDEAWVGLGRASFALGENKDAVEAYGLALHFNPRNFLARRSLARVYWREDQPVEAERELAQVASEHPDFAEGRAEHGLALVKVKRYREAIPELQAAAQLGYRDAIVNYYLGVCYSETGDDTRAIEAYQQAIAKDPNYAVAYLRLALQYRKSGELAKARQYYMKACKLSEQLCREFSDRF